MKIESIKSYLQKVLNTRNNKQELAKQLVVNKLLLYEQKLTTVRIYGSNHLAVFIRVFNLLQLMDKKNNLDQKFY